jgi:hypothetical protein
VRVTTIPPALALLSDRALAPTAESSPGTKIFFCKNVFHTKATPFMGRTIFGQVFVRGGMTEISKMKSPPYRGGTEHVQR